MLPGREQRRVLRPWPLLTPGLAAAILIAAAPPAPSDRSGQPLPAQDPAVLRRQLDAAQHERAAHLTEQRDAYERARQAAIDAMRLTAARIDAAAALRATEQATADASASVDALKLRRDQARARLAADASSFAPLLPVIERLSRYPSETLLAAPGDPARAVTGLLVLRAVARHVQDEAASLRDDQREADQLEAGLAAETQRLNDARAHQAAQEAALDEQIRAADVSARQAQSEATTAATDAAAAAARATSLKDAIASLAAAKRAAEARAAAEAARQAREQAAQAQAQAGAQQQAQAQDATQTHPGEHPAIESAPDEQAAASLPGLGAPTSAVTAPVAGTVTQEWGTPGEAGPATGITYRAAPGARVVSPCSGAVVFSGPFRSYGLLLIVDCGQGYHFVLAGLDRLDVPVGRGVKAGEPVGVMAGGDPRAQPERSSLYLELRQNGQPINPAPFLRGRG